MIYSVYNNHSKRYDYFESDNATINTVGHFRPPSGAAVRGSFLPEALARTVPAGARKVGSGDEARGVVAVHRGLVSGMLTPETRPSFAWGLLFAGAGFAVAWWWARQR